MRIADIIKENNDPESAVLDILTSIAGEGIDEIPLDTILSSLNGQGIDVDKASVFDLLDNLAIVTNIKNDIVTINTDSSSSQYNVKDDPEKQDKKVDSMARKQIDKKVKK